MEQLNRKLIKQRVKETVERSQDYIKKAKKNDRIRIHQAPCFPFKVNGVVREIAVRLKQDGKTVEAILQGMGYQKIIFTFKLSELFPSAFDKAKEAAKKASEAVKVATEAKDLSVATTKADEEAKKKKATSSSSAPKKRTPRKTTRATKKAAPETPDKP